MEPSPVYTTIAHADVPENGRMWRYSVVLRYVAPWIETWGDNGEKKDCHPAENDLYLYRHPADEELRTDGYHPRADGVMIDLSEGQAVAGDVSGEDWSELFDGADKVWPGWPTFSIAALYPQRQRLIVRLLQEAGVP